MKQICLGEEEAGYFGAGYSETPFAGWYVIQYLDEGVFDLHPANTPVPEGAVVVGTEEGRCTYRELARCTHQQWLRGFRLMQLYGEGTRARLSFDTPRAVNAIALLGGRAVGGSWVALPPPA